jgi:E3 ubiquitin-protein ligase BOI-like protein
MQQQQQISSLLLNLGNSPMDRNALIQACEEIDHNLCAQIQNTMELHQIISQHTDGLRDIIRRTSEMNYQLFLSQLPPVQGTAPESTGRSVICRVCYSRAACMLVLPCRHICACKSCEVTLTHCPICASTKANAVEVS